MLGKGMFRGDIHRPLLWSLRRRRREVEMHLAQPPRSLCFEATCDYKAGLKIQGVMNMPFTRWRIEIPSKYSYSLVLKKKREAIQAPSSDTAFGLFFGFSLKYFRGSAAV